MIPVMKTSSLTLLAAFTILARGMTMANGAITIDLVNVGNAGNAADTTGYGAVGYDYAIGKYDVTVRQYTTFLNAVDPNGTNPNGIYMGLMGSNLNVAGISYNAGASIGSKYEVMTNGGNSANRPITYVSWFDAARFSNWLQNGQGSGSTETGAYTLNGQTSGVIMKNDGATYWIPSEDEWYKAAYYDPNKAGGAGYWLYPTMSDSAPGNTIESAANNANYYNGVFSVTQYFSSYPNQNYLTDVGAFSGSGSAYGTYDQGGDVFQWNDAVSGGARGTRGGSWDIGVGALGLQSSYSSSCGPAGESQTIGFRIASVPEPSVVGMLLIAGAAGWWVKRRKNTL